MKFEDVLPALRAGKRVRRSAWSKGDDVVHSASCDLPMASIITDDWEIVKEKAKKTVWVNVLQGEHWYVTNGIFESEETAVIAAHRSGVKHIGTYSITMEVDE
jgi:hypothetical protein